MQGQFYQSLRGGKKQTKTIKKNQKNKIGKLKHLSSPREEGDKRKIMPFKLVMQVRRTGESFRASRKACLGVMSSRSKPEGTQFHAFKSQSKGLSKLFLHMSGSFSLGPFLYIHTTLNLLKVSFPSIKCYFLNYNLQTPFGVPSNHLQISGNAQCNVNGLQIAVLYCLGGNEEKNILYL